MNDVLSVNSQQGLHFAGKVKVKKPSSGLWDKAASYHAVLGSEQKIKKTRKKDLSNALDKYFPQDIPKGRKKYVKGLVFESIENKKGKTITGGADYLDLSLFWKKANSSSGHSNDSVSESSASVTLPNVQTLPSGQASGAGSVFDCSASLHSWNTDSHKACNTDASPLEARTRTPGLSDISDDMDQYFVGEGLVRLVSILKIEKRKKKKKGKSLVLKD